MQKIVTALIVNQSNQIFIQKRSLSRRLFPGKWDFVGGHVEADESLKTALYREVTEETGWQIAQVIQLVDLFQYQLEDEHYLDYVVLVKVAGDLQNPVVETDKVDSWQWIDPTSVSLLSADGRQVDDYITELLVKGFTLLSQPQPQLPFELSGTVIHGNKQGRTIGFPTLNIDKVPSESQLIPGVYFSSVTLENGDSYFGLAYFGPRYVKDEIFNVFEVYLYDFNQEIYHQTITVSCHYVQRFPEKYQDFEELKTALQRDKDRGLVFRSFHQNDSDLLE